MIKKLVVALLAMAFLVPALAGAELQCTMTSDGNKIFITVPSASEDMNAKDGFILYNDRSDVNDMGEFLIKPKSTIALVDLNKRYALRIYRAYYLPEYGKYVLQERMSFNLNLEASSLGEIMGAKQISSFKDAEPSVVYQYLDELPYVSGGSDGLVFFKSSYPHDKIKVTGYRSCGPGHLPSASVYINDSDQLSWSVLGWATRIEVCSTIFDSVGNREVKSPTLTMLISTNQPCH